MRLFELDRCMMESRLPTGDGRQLVIANVHLSAFDKGGFIRTQQLAFLKEYAARELESGNYVVIGGDWNHLLSSDPEAKKAEYGESWPFWLQVLPDDFVIDGFRWAVDETTPSCRTLDKPYVPGENIEVNIDGFLVSPAWRSYMCTGMISVSKTATITRLPFVSGLGRKCRVRTSSPARRFGAHQGRAGRYLPRIRYPVHGQYLSHPLISSPSIESFGDHSY
jgi:hypothetical protein